MTFPAYVRRRARATLEHSLAIDFLSQIERLGTLRDVCHTQLAFLGSM